MNPHITYPPLNILSSRKYRQSDLIWFVIDLMDHSRYVESLVHVMSMATDVLGALADHTVQSLTTRAI